MNQPLTTGASQLPPLEKKSKKNNKDADAANKTPTNQPNAAQSGTNANSPLIAPKGPPTTTASLFHSSRQNKKAQNDVDDINDYACKSLVTQLKNLFFVDSGKILKNSSSTSRKELEAYNLTRLPDQYSIADVAAKMREVREESQAKGEDLPLWRLYMRMEKNSIIRSTILRIVADLLLITIPLMCYRWEFSFVFNTRKDDPTKFTVNLQNVGTGLIWVLLITLSYFIQYMCRQHSEKLIFNVKFRMEQGIKNRLFLELLYADYISISRSDPNIMSKILFFGLDNILSVVVGVPGMISAPFAIILGCYLVAQVHTHMFYLLAIVLFVIIVCVIIELFNKASAKHQEDYDSIQSLKSIKVEEFFDNITTIQTNSLGECLKQRMTTIRLEANATLGFMHLAAGASEVLLAQSPFVFTAIALTIFHFIDLGNEDNDDGMRLTLCAMAPLVVPLKVLTESFYKIRLAKSGIASIMGFLASLKPKGAVLNQDAKGAGGRGRKYREYAVIIQNANFLKDEGQRETFDTVLNPKEEKGKPRFVMFRDRENDKSFSTQIGSVDNETIQKQKELTTRFTSNSSAANVNYCLKNINLRVKIREKICIVGSENSGKHDMFLALMQELSKVDEMGSNFYIKGKACYLDMNNPKFIRDTIKENILLGRELNKNRYNELINLVKLQLAKYPLKDRTIIVEGQKNIAENDVARILLARLLYSDAQIVMLNNYFDMLSKERVIATFDEIMEFLKDKTVIFSTENVHLIKKSNKVIMMSDGMIKEDGTYDQLMTKPKDEDRFLYKHLMTDPAGNTNIFRKVLDLFRIQIKKKIDSVPPEDPMPVAEKDSPIRKRGKISKEPSMNVDDHNLGSPGKGGEGHHFDKDKAHAAGAAATDAANNKTSVPVAIAPHHGETQNKALLRAQQMQQNTQDVSLSANKDLNKLERNIMSKSGLSSRVIFVGQSYPGYLFFMFSLIVTNVTMVITILMTCLWPRRILDLFEGYTSYLFVYDGLVIFYLAYIVFRDLVFTKMIIKNLDNIYNLVTNSLIDTQKEYLLQNPSTRIMYLMTKTVSKIDRDLIRSYYMYLDSILVILAILGMLNYVLYAFMNVVTIFLMIIIMPSYNTFRDICIKLSVFVANTSSELIEIYLSSFNFILPLRNHNIADYFDKKFTLMANIVMRGKVTLEDDINRWFHFRYCIYSTILVTSIMVMPVIVLQFFDTAYLNDPWQLKFIGASVPMLLPILINFSNSMVSHVTSMISANSILKYILELSKNSEDTTIIKRLSAMPKTKSKDYDEEDIQETNLINYILSNDPRIKERLEMKILKTSGKKVAPAKKGDALYRSNTGTGDRDEQRKKLRGNLSEPTKPLLMLHNVRYVSKIKLPILNGVNLKLYEAERLGLICELGSGKDFLINLLMTLLQRSESEADGDSTYEVMGVTVEIATSSDLRKNMTYLYAKPSLLMGTVRDNIDPFGKYHDDEIIRVLHFLKIIRVLQEYSGIMRCEDIELYLGAKESSLELSEILIEDIKLKDRPHHKKNKKDPTRIDDRFSNPRMSQADLASSVDKFRKTNISGGKNSFLQPGMTISEFDKKKSTVGNSGTPQTVVGKSLINLQQTTGPFGPGKGLESSPISRLAQSPMKSTGVTDPKFTGVAVPSAQLVESKVIQYPNSPGPDGQPPQAQINGDNGEEIVEEGEEDVLEEEVKQEEIRHEENSERPQSEVEIANEERKKSKSQYMTIMRLLREIIMGSESEYSHNEQQVNLFYNEQFTTDIPNPMPIPERAKRLDEDLEDFDMDFENHTIHFEDEKNLIKRLLKTEVGQNGKNLNDDCRRLIMMAKVYLDRPPILLLDEDALYITGVNRSFYIKQLFKNLKETGIVSIVKDLRQLYNYSKTAVLKGGRIIEQGPPFDLIDNRASELYSIVMRDDIRTLRQLENKLEKNIRKFEKIKKREVYQIQKMDAASHITGESGEKFLDSSINSPIARHDSNKSPLNGQHFDLHGKRTSTEQLTVPQRGNIRTSRSPMQTTIFGMLGNDNEGDDLDEEGESSIKINS